MMMKVLYLIVYKNKAALARITFDKENVRRTYKNCRSAVSYGEYDFGVTKGGHAQAESNKLHALPVATSFIFYWCVSCINAV